MPVKWTRKVITKMANPIAVSMSNSKRTQYIVSDARQTSEPFEEDPDIRKGDRLLLRIWYFEVTGWININSTHEDDDDDDVPIRDVTYEEPILLTDRFVPYNANFSEIRTLHERVRHTGDIAVALSFYLDVPDNEQPPIIAKILKVIDQEAVPNLLIDVVIHDVTLRSIKPFILGLKKVRLDSLDATEQKMSCAICLENFFDINDSLDDRHDQKLILRLPCSHLYHRHCMDWLSRVPRSSANCGSWPEATKEVPVSLSLSRHQNPYGCRWLICRTWGGLIR